MTRRRGANAVEFALLAPVLVALLSGIIDLSWMSLIRHSLDSSARAGARAGALATAGDADGFARLACLEQWGRVGLAGDPAIVSYRSGDPELMVVTLQIDTEALVGLIPGTHTLSVTATHHVTALP